MWKKTDSFFIITSENAGQISKSHLFGFYITEDKCFKNCDLEDDESVIVNGRGYGQYVYIKKNDTGLEISWDSNNSICLYVYETHDYWALSNSFWLLCDEVTKKYQITLDERFAMHYINATTSSISVKNTLAKEIKIVPLYATIHIKGTRLIINSVPKVLYSSSIDSKEGLSIIDQWIKDWIRLIRIVANSGYPIIIDLSGGFDSRIVFSLALASGIDFNAKNVCVSTKVSKVRSLVEDYNIASKICDYYGISLNKGIVTGTEKNLTGKQSFDLTWHSMLAVHKEPYYSEKYYTTPVFHIGGLFGEVVRGKGVDFDTWLSSADMHGIREFDIASYLEVIDSINELKQENDSLSRHASLVNLFRYTWGRNHFGLSSFRNACINYYELSPLSDSRLLQVGPLLRDNVGTDLIYAVILMRTSPELLEFSFANGERFSEEILRMADKITSREKIKLELVDEKRDFDELGNSEFREMSCGDSTRAPEILEGLFKDKANKNAFIERFGVVGEAAYRKAEKGYQNKSRAYPSSIIVPIVAIVRMLQYEKDSSPYNNRLVLQKQQDVMLKNLMKEYPNSKRLKIRSGIYIQQSLKQRNIKTIGVYGAGERGEWLCTILQQTNIEIVFVTDQAPEVSLQGYKMISLNEKFPQVDAVVVTPYGYFKEIEETLLKKDKTLKLIDMEELLK